MHRSSVLATASAQCFTYIISFYLIFKLRSLGQILYLTHGKARVPDSRFWLVNSLCFCISREGSGSLTHSAGSWFHRSLSLSSWDRTRVICFLDCTMRMTILSWGASFIRELNENVQSTPTQSGHAASQNSLNPGQAHPQLAWGSESPLHPTSWHWPGIPLDPLTG